ncbi:Uncharacterised protein [Mycobacterium tuberculosis]|nr:Uncharacterised protein [Mycobacterium tuberculosis]
MAPAPPVTTTSSSTPESNDQFGTAGASARVRSNSVYPFTEPRSAVSPKPRSTAVMTETPRTGSKSHDGKSRWLKVCSGCSNPMLRCIAASAAWPADGTASAASTCSAPTVTRHTDWQRAPICIG